MKKYLVDLENDCVLLKYILIIFNLLRKKV